MGDASGMGVAYKIGHFDGILGLALGGTDSKYFEGDITYHDLKAADYWRISIDSIPVDGTDYTGANNRVAIVDSGTSLLTGPSSAVESIATALNATANKLTGEYFVDCSADLPSMVVTI